MKKLRPVTLHPHWLLVVYKKTPPSTATTLTDGKIYKSIQAAEIGDLIYILVRDDLNMHRWISIAEFEPLTEASIMVDYFKFKKRLKQKV